MSCVEKLIPKAALWRGGASAVMERAEPSCVGFVLSSRPGRAARRLQREVLALSRSPGCHCLHPRLPSLHSCGNQTWVSQQFTVCLLWQPGWAKAQLSNRKTKAQSKWANNLTGISSKIQKWPQSTWRGAEYQFDKRKCKQNHRKLPVHTH